MARINLLPWREERRKERQTQFLLLLAGTALIAGLLLFLTISSLDAAIENQQTRNQTLEKKITELDQKIAEIEELEKTRSRLLARKEIIEDLQASRSQMVHLFDELVRTIPDGTQLISINQNGAVLTLNGVAQSNARVSQYLRNLDDSEWLHDPDLGVIQVNEDDPGLYRYSFTLTVRLTNPGAEDGEEDDADAATEAQTA